MAVPCGGIDDAVGVQQDRGSSEKDGAIWVAEDPSGRMTDCADGRSGEGSGVGAREAGWPRGFSA